MRAALLVAFRRGLARVALAVGLLGLLWTALHEAWPWVHGRGAIPASALYIFPDASPWDLPVAAVAFVLAVSLSVLIYRRRATSR